MTEDAEEFRVVSKEHAENIDKLVAERDDLREELSILTPERDLYKASSEALEEAWNDSEKRLAALAKAFSGFRDVVLDCERLASSYSPCIDSVDENGGDNHEDPTCAIFHRLYYAMFDADAALAKSSK